MKKLVSILLSVVLLVMSVPVANAGGVFYCDIMFRDFKGKIVGEGGAPRIYLEEYCGSETGSVSLPTTVPISEMLSMIPEENKKSGDYEYFILNEIVSDDMLIQVVLDERVYSTIEVNTYKDYEDIIKVFVDGAQIVFDQNPIIINDRTMVPMRAIFEALDAEISWDETTKTVTATKNEKNILVQIDNNIMKVDNTEIKLDVAPQIVSDRTMVPVRAISEALNCIVYWDAKEENVIILDRKPIGDGDVEVRFYYAYVNGPLTAVDEKTEEKMRYTSYVKYEGFKKILTNGDYVCEEFYEDGEWTTYENGVLVTE